MMPPDQIATPSVRYPDMGPASVCQAGREPIRYEFRQAPGPRLDGARRVCHRHRSPVDR